MGKALVSFIEHLQGHLGTDQAAGGRSEMPLSLPVLEELLEDGTLTALGQNLHLQGQEGKACSQGCHLCLQGRAEPGGGCWAPGPSPHALPAKDAPDKTRNEKDQRDTAEGTHCF